MIIRTDIMSFSDLLDEIQMEGKWLLICRLLLWKGYSNNCYFDAQCFRREGEALKGYVSDSHFLMISWVVVIGGNYQIR